MTIRVVVVDDHPVVRSGLVALLDLEVEGHDRQELLSVHFWIARAADQEAA